MIAGGVPYRCLAGGGGNVRDLRSPVWKKHEAYVNTAKPLVLTYDHFSEKTARLYQELRQKQPLTTEDMRRVIWGILDGGHSTEGAGASRTNQIMYALLTNSGFHQWFSDYRLRIMTQLRLIKARCKPREAMREALLILDKPQLFKDMAHGLEDYCNFDLFRALVPLEALPVAVSKGVRVGMEGNAFIGLDAIIIAIVSAIDRIFGVQSHAEAGPEGHGPEHSHRFLVSDRALSAVQEFFDTRSTDGDGGQEKMEYSSNFDSIVNLSRFDLRQFASIIAGVAVEWTNHALPNQLLNESAVHEWRGNSDERIAGGEGAIKQFLSPIPRQKTLSLMLTFRCTAACKHCSSHSNPKQAEYLDPDLMLSTISQAAVAGYGTAAFTGGEPTLARDALLQGIRLASASGLHTRMVSNGWWATDERAAHAQIARLIDAGLEEINLSTGDQHTRFVPLDNILRACRAAASVPLKTTAILIETVAERTITKRTVFKHPEFQKIRQDFPLARIFVLESPWMPLSPSKTAHYPEGIAATSHNLPLSTGCMSCLGTTTLQADGNIGACCGAGMRSIPELQLGNIRDITLVEADRRGANDFLKRWIRLEGPEKILAWAGSKDPEIEWEGMYGHPCQSCLRMHTDPKVRNLILKHHREKMSDVVTAEWLLYEFAGKHPVLDGRALVPLLDSNLS